MAKKGRLTTEEKTRLQEHAKLLFLAEKITAKDLAEKVGVSEKTIGDWIKEEKWERLKRNTFLTRQEQHAKLLEELERMNEDIALSGVGYADSKQANARRLLVRDIKDLEGEAIGVSDIISVQVGFIEFARKRDAEQAKTISDLSDLYIKSKL